MTLDKDKLSDIVDTLRNVRLDIKDLWKETGGKIDVLGILTLAVAGDAYLSACRLLGANENTLLNRWRHSTYPSLDTRGRDIEHVRKKLSTFAAWTGADPVEDTYKKLGIVLEMARREEVYIPKLDVLFTSLNCPLCVAYNDRCSMCPVKNTGKRCGQPGSAHDKILTAISAGNRTATRQAIWEAMILLKGLRQLKPIERKEFEL